MLSAQFGSALAPELFDVSVGAVVTEPDLPEPKSPTLFVTHVAEWSGHNYTTTRPRGSFIGVTFNFDATFVIPGDSKPYKFKAEIFRHAATHVLAKPNEPLPAKRRSIVVTAAPTSVTNITGFFHWWSGLSFLKLSTIAGLTMAGSSK